MAGYPVIQRVPWTVQPQGAAGVDPSGFLRNPKFLTLGSALGYDAGIKQPHTVSGYTKTASYKGGALSSSGTGGNTDRVVGNACGDISGPLTLVWVGRLLATGGLNYDSLIGNGVAGAANGIGIGIWGTAGADKDKPYFETFSSGAVQKYTPISSQSAVSQTEFHVLVGTTDTTTLTLYQNGVQVSSVATLGALPASSTSRWRLGARASFNFGAPQQVVLAGVLSGCRTAAEVAEFTRNIWAGFSPLPRTIWAPAAAGGGGISATLSATLDAATSTATGTLPIAAVASQTLEALTSSAAATLAITSSTSATLENASTSAAATLALKAASSPTLADVTSSSAAALALQASISQTLADATLSATGTSAVVTTGAVAATLADATSASTATVLLAGSASITLDACTIVATGTLALKASVSSTLANATLSAAGENPDAVVTFTANQRTLTVAAQDRSHLVAAERRAYTIAPQNRTHTV